MTVRRLRELVALFFISVLCILAWTTHVKRGLPSTPTNGYFTMERDLTSSLEEERRRRDWIERDLAPPSLPSATPTSEAMLNMTAVTAQDVSPNQATTWTDYQDPTYHALSKAFGLPEFEPRIYPFYFARHSPRPYDEDDLTLTVFITPNRFDRLVDLVLAYTGPISAVLHIDNKDQDVRATLRALEEMYMSDPIIEERLDIHLVSSGFARQLNAWRNYARVYARTKYVMMLDIDLTVRTDLRSALREVLERDDEVSKGMQEGTAALVVPPFEYKDPKAEPDDWRRFPSDKEALTEAWHNGTIMYFYQIRWPIGQAPTNHPKYFELAPTSPGDEPTYPVTQWKLSYEPYLIFKKKGPPYCDEVFIGFGHNKEACVGEMLLSGMRLHVLKDHFITHRKHTRDAMGRYQSETDRNNRIWEGWEKSQCARYTDLLSMKGSLHTAQKSLIEVCSRHKQLNMPKLLDNSKKNAKRYGLE